MSPLVEPEPVETLEFKWGTKRGRGGKKKEVQFYESFTYDGVDYTLYDTVYLYKEGEPEPYIGKLIKIWELQDKTMAKKVKVHWFFRPSEISNWIEEGMVLEKEIFLASGEGVCTAGVNPLEAISGKCNVVCTIDDERNPQPTPQELELADYFFYRTFNVEHCTISDLMGDKVAGLEVKFVFNRKEYKNNSEVIPDKKDEGEKAMSVDAVDSGYVKKISFQRNLSSSNATSLSRGSKDIKIDKPNKSYSKTNIEYGVKLAKTSGDLENRLPSKLVVAGSEASCKNMTAKSMETLNVESNDSMALKQTSSFTDRMMNSGEQKDSMGSDKLVEGAKSDISSKKLDSKSSLQKPGTVSEKNNGKDLFTSGRKRKPKDDCVGPDKDLKPQKTEEKMTKLSDGKLPNASARDSPREGRNEADKFLATRKPNDDLKQQKTEEKMTKVSDGKLPNASARDSPREGRSEADKFLAIRQPNDDLKQQKTEEKMTNLSDGKLPNASARDSLCEGRSEADKFLVTRKPNDQRSKWFKIPPWEERIKTAYEQATLVQLLNLDPKYTSSEVEDIIWHAFEEHCTAKMVQRTASSSPNYGHAFIIMKTRAVADMIIRKLEDGCLILSNGRPLVGRRVPHLSFPGKQFTFVGHLFVDKMKHQMQRDMREAVSTSHCSQPNTVEFEMAMEWCLLQSRSDGWWKRLHKKQGEEMRKLKANLKLKPVPNTSTQ